MSIEALRIESETRRAKRKAVAKEIREEMLGEGKTEEEVEEFMHVFGIERERGK